MKKHKIELSIRIDLPGGTRFGPGKAELLRLIEKKGSISAAATKLNMSYPRALRLVNEMNQQFTSPLVEKYQGGASRGGAHLTSTGTEILSLYQELSDIAADQSANLRTKIAAHLTK